MEKLSGNKNGMDSLLGTLFVNQLKDIYWAEKHLVKAIPKMIKAATTEDLKGAFTSHLDATEEHVSRLEEAFEMLDKKAQAKKCEAMDGITREAESMIAETEEDTFTRDAALIMAAQKVEHYEIATYSSLIQLAKTMGLDEMAELLRETLEEEKDADELLTSIAENYINEWAENEPTKQVINLK